MFKAVITGDWHIKGVNPLARKDNFLEAVTRKIYEAYDIARQMKANVIICPGDVFDSPGTALGTIAELGCLLSLAPCPVLAIPGNHDIWGHNPGSKPRTPYGLLARLGLIWDLTDEPYDGDRKVCITGHGYNTETDTPLGKEQFNPPQFEEPTIHVVHSMLLTQAPGFDMRHTLIDDVVTSAKVIISGHYHTGWGIVAREDGTLFINPGALSRTSAHVEEMQRRVQVCVLTVDGGTYSAELVPLRSALPGPEVLSREHIEAETDRNERLEKFLALLAKEGAQKFMEVRDIIEDIAAREELPEEVKAEALKRIGDARERLGV